MALDYVKGWWQYDVRTSQEIEDAYARKEKTCSILVAGYLYCVDFESMIQMRQDDPSRRRRVKRDLASVPKKGVAGLRIDSNNVVVTDATPTTSEITTSEPVPTSFTTDSPLSARMIFGILHHFLEINLIHVATEDCCH
uniref:E3 ubiquitin-protein ligase n=1 Tax=Phlebotomus papatasi TaxID=29031 RepID=A0A1B0DDH9_PHLPP